MGKCDVLLLGKRKKKKKTKRRITMFIFPTKNKEVQAVSFLICYPKDVKTVLFFVEAQLDSTLKFHCSRNLS